MFRRRDEFIVPSEGLGMVLMNTDDERSDPLTQIDGISVELRKTLGAEFDIHTVEDLARCSGDTAREISSRLRNVSQRDVTTWIVNAREIVAGAEEQFARPNEREHDDAQSGEHLAVAPEESFKIEAGDQPGWEDIASVMVNFQLRQPAEQPEERRINVYRIQNSGKDAEFSDFDYEGLGQWMSKLVGNIQARRTESGWEDIASVLVNFQLRKPAGELEERRINVHRMQNGGKDAEINDFDLERLGQWMSAQIDEIQAREIEDGVTLLKEKTDNPTVAQVRPAVQINWVQAFQPPVSQRPVSTAVAGEDFSNGIAADSPFSLETSFTLPQDVVVTLAEAERRYRARFYVRRITTGEKMHLGDSEYKPLVKNQMTYVSKLVSAVLSPGPCRLHVVLELQAEPSTVHHIEVPLLYVG